MFFQNIRAAIIEIWLGRTILAKNKKHEIKKIMSFGLNASSSIKKSVCEMKAELYLFPMRKELITKYQRNKSALTRKTIVKCKKMQTAVMSGYGDPDRMKVVARRSCRN